MAFLNAGFHTFVIQQNSRSSVHFSLTLSFSTRYPYIRGFVSLQINSTKVHLHAHGWGPEDHSGIDLLKATESTVFIRPNDTFEIGEVILQIERRKGLDHEPIDRLEGAVQAAPMANGNNRKRKRVKQESEDEIAENCTGAGGQQPGR